VLNVLIFKDFGARKPLLYSQMATGETIKIKRLTPNAQMDLKTALGIGKMVQIQETN